ncbi:unnamed protein product [Effrenium voratum]|nr:unnamed protein product [Effrenium voratum]
MGRQWGLLAAAACACTLQGCSSDVQCFRSANQVCYKEGFEEAKASCMQNSTAGTRYAEGFDAGFKKGQADIKAEKKPSGNWSDYARNLVIDFALLILILVVIGRVEKMWYKPQDKVIWGHGAMTMAFEGPESSPGFFGRLFGPSGQTRPGNEFFPTAGVTPLAMERPCRLQLTES